MRVRCIPVGTSPHEVDCARRRSVVYRLMRAAQRPRCACCARKCTLLGTPQEVGVGRSYNLVRPLEVVANYGVPTLNTRSLRNGLAVNWSSRGQLFSLFINSTYSGSGIISGVGDHSLSSGLESAGVDAVVALGRAARAPVPAGHLHSE